MNRKKLKKLIITALAAVVVLTCAVTGFAGSSLLSPGTSRTIAGYSFDFTLNLKSLDTESSDAEVDGAGKEYVVALSVSPDVSAMSVKEGVGSLNAVTGEYQVTSDQLGDISVLHFSVTPSESITTETTYKVSVQVSGDVKGSDSFNLIVVPKETQEEPSGGDDNPGDNPGDNSGDNPTDDNTGDNSGENTGDNPVPGQTQPEGQANNNMTMPSGKNMGKMPSMKGSMPNVSVGGVSGSVSSTASNLIYAGSWDNYLDELSVEGYEFTQKFNKIRDTYILTVPESVTEVTVNATPSDSSADVAVTGDTDLPKGRSKIMVSVTADDGSVRIYRIYVDRTGEEETGDGGETNV